MYELFHSIGDPSSGRVRRFITDYGLEDRVRFRNVAYPEVERDLRSLGAAGVPALWDGSRMVQGAEAAIAELSRLTNIGRAP